MNLRFYIDPETGEPHLSRHGVTEQEAAEVINCPGEDRAGRDGSRIALGQTQAGRYLRVVYVPDPEPGSAFVITAYELQVKPLAAYRKRRRRKAKVRKNNFPPGWDEERVRRLLAHYEQQSESEAVAEDEAACEDQGQTIMEVPTELVPAIRDLIARRQS